MESIRTEKSLIQEGDWFHEARPRTPKVPEVPVEREAVAIRYPFLWTELCSTDVMTKLLRTNLVTGILQAIWNALYEQDLFRRSSRCIS